MSRIFKVDGRQWFKNILDVMNEFFAQVRIVEINGNKYVLKEYESEHGLIKWFLIKTAGVTTKVYPYTMDPLERMVRETKFMDDVRDIVNTPKIILRDWIGRSIVREYVEGEPFKPTDDPRDYRGIAEVLAEIHRYGYALGDTKFYNFIRTDQGYYVIDGEQAIKTDDPSFMYWDIMVFTITVVYGLINTYLGRSLKIVPRVLEGFIKSYLENGGEYAYRVLSMYNKFNYITLTYVLLPIPYNRHYIRVVESLI